MTHTQKLMALCALLATGCAQTIDFRVGDGDGDVACTPGVAECVAAPRLIAPLSTARVTTRRPTLRWEPSAGAATTVLELCRDRACGQVERSITVEGGRATLAEDLTPGTHFWRVSARAASGRVSRSAVWQFESGRRAAAADTSFGSAPDFNGDGVSELLVGAPEASAQLGEAYVFEGSRAGLATQPALTFTCDDGPRSLLGRSITSAGDLDGDGFPEMVVGAYGVSDNAGRAYVYTGGAAGLSLARRVTLVGPDRAESFFGYFVDGVGDVNGDGYGDLAVSAYGTNRGVGTVYLYFGSAQGVSRVPSVELAGVDGEGGFYGAALAGGDLNGDGYADLVVGALGVDGSTGRVYVYPGGADGVRDSRRTTLRTTDAMGGWFGRWVSVLGDVNGDGYPDLGVAEDHFSDRPGRFWVYPGGPTGVDDARRTVARSSTAGFTAFTNHITGIGDVNADGYDDVLVGEQVRAGGGGASLYLGGPDGVGREDPVRGRAPDLELGPPEGAGSQFGRAVGGLHDVNGDGIPDIAVTADQVDGGLGRVYVYYGAAGTVGRATTRSELGREPDVILRGRRAGGLFGWHVSALDPRPLGGADGVLGGGSGVVRHNRHPAGLRAGAAVCAPVAAPTWGA